MATSHIIAELERAVLFNFRLGLAPAGRRSDHTADTELEAVAAWAKDTMEQYLVLDSVLTGRTVLALRDGQLHGRKPTEAELGKLRAWLAARALKVLSDG